MNWFLVGKNEKNTLTEVLDRLCDPGLGEEGRALAWSDLQKRHSSISVSSLIEAMGPWLQNNDMKVIECAIRVIVQLIEERELRNDEVASLAEFCAKMSLIPACTASALNALFVLLLRQQDEVQECATKLLLDGELHVSAFGHRARQKAWDILDQLCLHNNQEDGIRLANGIASALQGEKDPRCLLRGLRCTEHALSRNGNEEILYNAVSPYFPIAFLPPKNDPFRVTPERLRRALRRCLTATPYISYLATDAAIVLLLGDDEPAEPHEADEALILIATAYRWPTLSSDKKKTIKILAAVLSIATQRRVSEHNLTHCIQTLFFYSFDNVSAYLHAEPIAQLFSEIRPETIDGRFSVAIGIAIARGAGYIGWRYVFDALGNSLIDRVLRETEQNALCAALDTLVQLIDIPSPALYFVASADTPLIKHRSLLLEAFGPHETDYQRAGNLRLRGFAALARRGNIIDTSQVVQRLIYQLKSKPHQACAELVLARPTAALEVVDRIDHLSDCALLTLAPAEGIFDSAKFATLLGDEPSTQVLQGLRPYATRMTSSLVKRWLEHAAPDNDEYAAALAMVVTDLNNTATIQELAVMATRLYTQNPTSRPAVRVLEVLARQAQLSQDLLTQIARAGAEPAFDEASLTVLVAAFTMKKHRDLVLNSSSVLKTRWICAARAALASGDFLPAALDPLRAIQDSMIAALAANAIATIVGLPPLPGELIFWRQRLYAHLSPRLRDVAVSGSEPAATALLALARAAPRATLIADTYSFVDVALGSHAKLAAPFFYLLLDSTGETALDAIRPRLEAVLDKLIEILVVKDDNLISKNPRPKLDALRSIAKLAHLLPHSSLFPFRRKLATALRVPLDDRSREVRRLTALVRNDWLANFGGSIV